MRLYYRGAIPPRAGDWVNFQSDTRAGLCSNAHLVTRVSGPQVHFMNLRNEDRYKLLPSVLFIGTEAECVEAFKKSAALARELEAEYHDMQVRHAKRIDNLKILIAQGVTPRGG